MNWIVASIVSFSALLIILIVLYFITQWNKQEGSIFQSNRHLDTTLSTGGGILLAVVIITLLFVAHIFRGNDEETILTQAVVMAIVSIPQTMFAYALGKQNGENGASKNEDRKRIERIEEYLSGEDTTDDS